MNLCCRFLKVCVSKLLKIDGVAWADALHREPVSVDVSVHEGEKVKQRTIWSRRYVCVLWDQREAACEAAWVAAVANGRHAASAVGEEVSASDSKIRQEHTFNLRSHSTIYCASPRKITKTTLVASGNHSTVAFNLD